MIVIVIVFFMWSSLKWSNPDNDTSIIVIIVKFIEKINVNVLRYIFFIQMFKNFFHHYSVCVCVHHGIARVCLKHVLFIKNWMRLIFFLTPFFDFLSIAILSYVILTL